MEGIFHQRSILPAVEGLGITTSLSVLHIETRFYAKHFETIVAKSCGEFSSSTAQASVQEALRLRLQSCLSSQTAVLAVSARENNLNIPIDPVQLLPEGPLPPLPSALQKVMLVVINLPFSGM